jgi:hypothetical protein
VIPLLGGTLALGLAWWAQTRIESGERSHLDLLFYLISIALFAASAWPLPPTREDLLDAADPGFPLREPPATRLRPWQVLAAGIALALLLNGIALTLIRDNLGSILGAWLWITGLVVMLATGIALHGWGRWPARWHASLFPRDRRWLWALLGLSVAILLAAAAARLLALDDVPFGINADEGDRAAESIQIARGVHTRSIFDSGWYHISNVYFYTLAAVMKFAGINFVGARVLGALAGFLSVAIVTWIGIRHFSWRVGLLAGGILSVLAVALQFSRETTEAGPTATLWAASVALFLEAARTGRIWAWIGAGLSGGMALYFYPSGRLWALLAALICLYLLIHGLGGRRLAILRGTVLAALTSLMVAAPFVVTALTHDRMSMLTTRAEETSIFTGDNVTRLSYYRPEWSLTDLLGEQAIRTMGIFSQFRDEGGFWPTDKPIMSGFLTVFTLLGIGWCCTRWRDPRYLILAFWFGVGTLGTLITVETPNLQRMATAVPVLGLFPALVLDSLARRVELALRRGDRQQTASAAPELLATGQRPPARSSPPAADGLSRFVRILTTTAAAIVVLLIGRQQYQVYFVDYASTDRWPQPTNLGNAVREQGSDSWVFTVGRNFHMVNAGWVRLLAPDTPRGGIQSPGAHLPISIPADRNLVFLIFPAQAYYVPYISTLYPHGLLKPYSHSSEGLMFGTYRLSREAWADMQGALATPAGAAPQRVGTLGEAPSDLSTFPVQMQWTALLRVPQYGNYSFEWTGGQLSIGGRDLSPPSSIVSRDDFRAAIFLARGEHYVNYTKLVSAPDQFSPLRWASIPLNLDVVANPALADNLDWQPIPTHYLTPTDKGAMGLYGEVKIEGQLSQRRLDPTLATCCLTPNVSPHGKPYEVTWRGTLQAPDSGKYLFSFVAHGALTMSIDNAPVLEFTEPSDEKRSAEVDLAAGPHNVEILYRVNGTGGTLEWIWTPPGGPESIVPPTVLSPPPEAAPGPPIPPTQLITEMSIPPDSPIETVP